MPHVHLSFQAGDDMVLKRMKRRHSRAQSVALVERLKAARPEIAIGADLIAGFPTESEAMFEGTLALIDDCDIVHAHIFPYSSRDGTPAARMPLVESEVVKARAARLREAAARRRDAWLRGLIGAEQQVLLERPGDRGHAGNFAEVRLSPFPCALSLSKGSFSSLGGQDQSGPSTSAGRTEVGKIVKARIEAVQDGKLIGTLA